LSNVIRFSGSKEARAKAAERAGQFLARLDAGASNEDLEQIRAWLAEDPLHQEVFLELAAVWDQMSVLSSLSDVFPLKEYARETSHAARSATWGLAAAACLVLAIGAGWLLREPAPQAQATPVFPEPEGFVQQFHETKIGEQATITLPDASELILNTNTVVEVVYSKTGRNIFLTRGEALFTVSKDPSRPFRVYAGRRMIEAVGTTFTVLHTQPDNVQVVVKEGRVNFLPMLAAMEPQTLPEDLDTVLFRNENVPVSAGETANSMNGQGTNVELTRIRSDELDVKLAWTHGMLLFQGNTLEQVLEEVGRYTTVKIEAEPGIRDIQVDGYFRAGDIDGLLVAMQQELSIESDRLADDHIMLRAGN
jgi:transmembrane sensor